MPLISQVVFDELLTNVSLQYQPTQGGYLADQVLPAVPVKKESAIYWKYDKSRFDVPDALRAPRSHYNKIDWKTTQDSYSAQEFGLEGEIDDRERDNAASPLDLDIDTAEIVTDMILNNREKRVADLVLNTANVTQNITLAGATQWSDETSDPIAAVATGRNTIYDATGYEPNTMLMGRKVFEALKRHPAILERIQFSERALITKQILAAFFEVDEIIVGGVMRRTSQEDAAVETIADTWGSDVLLYFKENRPGLKKASFGYQFRVRDLRTFRYRDESRATDIVRVTEVQAEKLVAPELAYLIKAAAA